jgi:pimeloyl-ACP methyl ester carboxylesterase
MILNYYEKGNKENPVVVFIHGSASDATVWLNELNLVAAQGYYCLAVDARGHGETRIMEQPREHVKIDIDSHIHDIVQTLEYLEIFPNREVTIVTHSFGGLVAVNLAELYPELIKKLILVCIPPRLVFPISSFLKLLLGKPLDFIQKNLDVFQKSPLRSRYKSSILTNAHVLQEIYKHVKKWNGFRKVPRLKNMKIFFAAGRFDLVAPAPLIQRLHMLTFNSEFELFKWSGHALMEDEPQKFQDWLLKSIKDKSSAEIVPESKGKNKDDKNIKA